jgi:hypothetical protein
MAKKPSNKARKLADKALRKITKEEYDEESERYRNKNTGEYTRGPPDKDED